MAKKKETTSEIYYSIEKVKIVVKPGATVILQSGTPQPPPKPPGGGH